MNTNKDDLAFALFRRHLIDQVEKRRMDLSITGQKSSAYDFYRDELDERGIKTSWSADGKTRSYWYSLAAEALRQLNGDELTSLPQSLTCRQCNGTGALFVVTEEGLHPRVAKAQGKLERQTCNVCEGTGI